MQINWFRSFTLYFLAKKIRNNIQTPFITFFIDHFTTGIIKNQNGLDPTCLLMM